MSKPRSPKKSLPAVVSGLAVSSRREGAVGWISLRGEARMEEIHRLLEEAQKLGAAGARSLLLDCSGLVFMDSASIGAFMALDRDLSAAGGRLVLYAVPRPVERVLEATGLLGRFSTAPDEGQALVLASKPRT